MIRFIFTSMDTTHDAYRNLVSRRRAAKSSPCRGRTRFFVSPVPNASSVTINYSPVVDFGPLFAERIVKDYTITPGVRVDLPSSWQADFYVGYSRDVTDSATFNGLNSFYLTRALADTNPATAFNPFGEGVNTNPATIESIRGYGYSGTRSTLRTANLIVDGPLFPVWGGDVRLAIGGEFRSERLSIPDTIGSSSAAPVTRRPSPSLKSQSVCGFWRVVCSNC